MSGPRPGATPPESIRNFCIIAHIDHGKSTLADRMLQLTGVVDARSMRAQYLDRMDIERERGITIKSQAVRMPWQNLEGADYVLNMIDTPGHVDFTYEVSRSLAACEGAILLIDAAQGIEAQTLANLYLALDADLHIIPVLNKIDLPSAQPEKFAAEIAHLVGCEPSEVFRVSAKTGEGVTELLDAIVEQIPGPGRRSGGAPARALIFDSVYDTYRGVVTYVRVVDGALAHRDRILMMSTKATHEVLELGVISPEPLPSKGLGVGEVGYLITGVKDVRQSRVGDTVTLDHAGGHRESGRLPAAEPDGLRRAVPDRRRRLSRAARGAGQAAAQRRRADLRAGDVRGAGLRLPGRLPGPAAHGDRPRAAGARVQPRPDLDRAERGVPGGDGGRQRALVTNPSEYPEGKVAEVWEPVVKATILTPTDYIGTILELCQARRGVQTGMDYLSEDRVEIRYQLPLAEIVFDFFDALKSRTKGYASLDYDEAGEQVAKLVKVDILLHGEPVDAFSAIVHTDAAYAYGVAMAKKLKELIPRQQFEVPIQAAIGSRVIARETVRAMRKDVLAKCYGGDITRKRKLLEKQKEGKKRMKMVGRVEVPQEAFVAALSTGETSKK